MGLSRLVRHLAMPPWRVRGRFPAAALQRIERAIGESERTHAGQLRFAVEAALDPLALWRGVDARERALEVFSTLRVWDTEANNGVLIYLLLADHDVEIVADRGIHRRVGPERWEAICREMESAFRVGRFEAGVLAGIEAVSAELSRHFPAAGRGENELPDRPVML